ncbi:MAG TPA: hypothetical protein VFK57_00530 [Vicinamibacterales bacterium]|nr:hypothetical protein [Vicinamibacterales bacterium]
MRRMAFAAIASLCLGAVMTLGDWLWAALQIRHRVVYGLLHGALMCLCLGIAVGVRAGKPAPAALAGPIIGVLAAASFYALAPAMGWNAMFPAWMLLWILFALLQHRLAKKEAIAAAVVRGGAAALASGAAFYAISGIWINDSHTNPNLIRHFFAWTVAFLPGFAALFWTSRRA